jgi:hypothetical protein
LAQGFTFLRIPRSYYGVITIPFLLKQLGSGFTEDGVRAILEACIKSGVTSKDGAVDLELSRLDISDRLGKQMTGELAKAFDSQMDAVVDAILFSRYANLYSLLRHHVTEETYLGIVRNQILVDVQVRDFG